MLPEEKICIVGVLKHIVQLQAEGGISMATIHLLLACIFAIFALIFGGALAIRKKS